MTPRPLRWRLPPDRRCARFRYWSACHGTGRCARKCRPRSDARACPTAPSCWEGRNLSARLRARGDEHWAVWIDWYEAWLAGGGELSEKDEIARVSPPNEPERKVRRSPTPAFRDLASIRDHRWRAA